MDHADTPIRAEDNEGCVPLEDAATTIDSLRQRLRQRPRNARVMSQLACLLASPTKQKVVTKDELSLSLSLLSEAMGLAQRAVEVAPHKPFGYAALSRILPEFDDRRVYLKQALDRTEGHPQHLLARLELAVRWLVEPRRHAASRATMGTASPLHPNQRALTGEEEETYALITQCLQEAWSRESTFQPFQLEHMAQQEQCLGLFFRKKLPREIHQARSRNHFAKVCDKLPLDHSLRRIAEFWWATLSSSSSDTTQRVQACPKAYLLGLYSSSFAARFDKLLLESLQYSTPTELRRLVDQVVLARQTGTATTQKWARTAVDLGCGTGLSGLAFQDCLTDDGHLVGVDLSPEMLAQAKQRNCYQELIEGDLLEGLLLARQEKEIDLITACDVLVYRGNLGAIFRAAQESLATPHGLFALSTELLLLEDGTTPPQDFWLQPCARFAHSQDYIQRLALESGLVLCGHRVCTIRKNQGTNVAGSLVVLRKRQPAEEDTST